MADEQSTGKRIDFRGRAAYALAFSLGASILILSSLAALDIWRSGELSATTGGLLASVFSGIIGAVATYMGGRSTPTAPAPKPEESVADYQSLVDRLKDVKPVQGVAIVDPVPDVPDVPDVPPVPQMPSAPQMPAPGGYDPFNIPGAK